ncbi:hypothetical protein [Mitsuokella sp.]|uniref:hypothetical protein n=1 Tax=Mitsuokella sp. TaxID=2049034 RepID=UPI003D7EEC0A
MGNDYTTCYKIKGNTEGMRRLVRIVHRILRWRGSYEQYWRHPWDPEKIYGPSCRESQIQLICLAMLHDIDEQDLQELPDGQSLLTFWTETHNGPIVWPWYELTERYVPDAEIWYYTEDIWGSDVYTNDICKRYFPHDYVLCLQGDKQSHTPELDRLRSEIAKPQFYREWPAERQDYISYWTTRELAELLRRVLRLSPKAYVDVPKIMEHKAKEWQKQGLSLLWEPIRRRQRQESPCDDCLQRSSLWEENFRLEEQRSALERLLEELQQAGRQD